MEEAYIPVIVYRVSDGTQAMEYLYSHQHPDLVFLDLNMPRVTGWEVLRAMRADEKPAAHSCRYFYAVFASRRYRTSARARRAALHYKTLDIHRTRCRKLRAPTVGL